MGGKDPGRGVKLSELLRYNLQSVRSYLLREDFQRFWEYQRPNWAGRFLDQWCTRTMRAKLEPMKKVARSLRERRGLILNWFRAKGTISSDTVEGLNNKVKLTTRKSYGFRTLEGVKIALYQTSAPSRSRNLPTNSAEEASSNHAVPLCLRSLPNDTSRFRKSTECDN